MNTDFPQDPAMLMSFINMKFRDEDYGSLQELCDALDMDHDQIVAALAKGGFEYNPTTNRIW